MYAIEPFPLTQVACQLKPDRLKVFSTQQIRRYGLTPRVHFFAIFASSSSKTGLAILYDFPKANRWRTLPELSGSP